MKSTFKIAGFAAVACALSLSLASCGNSTTTTSTSDSTSATSVDRTANAGNMSKDTMAANANNNGNMANNGMSKEQDFVTDVVKQNTMEMHMLQGGIKMGTNKMIKSDAEKMMADHKKMAMEVMNYAKKKNLTLPSDTTTMENDMSAMNGKTGADFDKMWVSDMMDGHNKTIARFEKGQNEVTDPELKTMITNTLPTLKQHLAMVQQLQSSMK